VLEVRRERLDQRPARLQQGQVHLVDQVPAGVPVAGERALGEQVGAAHRTRGLGPARGRPVRGQRRPRRRVRLGQVGGDRADDDWALSEEVADGLGRGPGVLDAAEHHDEPVTLHRAQGVHPGRPGRPAYLVEGVGLAARVRHAAQHHGHVAARGPAQGAGPRQQVLVGLRAQHRVDHQGLEAGVPGAAHLRGPGVDLRRREGDLAGIAEHGRPDVRGVDRVEQLVDVRLDDLDREPDQADGLLEVDHAGERARRGAEHRGDHLGGARRRLVTGLAVPVDEAPDAGLHDHRDPRTLLGAEVAEPRQVLLHPRHGGRAEGAGRPLERVGGAPVGRRGLPGGHRPRLVATAAARKTR